MMKENLVTTEVTPVCINPTPNRYRCGNREVDFTFRAPEKKYILRSRSDIWKMFSPKCVDYSRSRIEKSEKFICRGKKLS